MHLSLRYDGPKHVRHKALLCTIIDDIIGEYQYDMIGPFCSVFQQVLMTVCKFELLVVLIFD